MVRAGVRLVWLGTLLGLPLLSVAAQTEREVFAVSFIRPSPMQPVLGATVIELRVEHPETRTIIAIEIFADGVAIGRLAQAPWRLTWDAGSEARGHTLEAVAHLDDGREARAHLRTGELRFTETTRVTMVNVDAFVRDPAGRYVTDLTSEDFVLTENGHPEAIERFASLRKPLKIALVIDTSLSMEGQRIEAAKKAAVQFLETLEEGDEAAVIVFSDEVRTIEPMTGDRAALRGAILSATAAGGTALYDAIWRASRLLSGYDGRRVLVLLSDGRDEASNGLEPGSLHTLEEALERALRDEVMIFAVGVGKNLERELDFRERRSLRSILEELAEKTGGRAVFVESRPGRLSRAFVEVAEDLRHMYSLAYVPDQQPRDGSWRAIELRTKDPKLTVYARAGYFAE